MDISKLLQEKRRYNLPEQVSEEEKAQLKANMPIQKIMGFINFDNLVIKVDRQVLIPRYETEEVILKACEYINANSKVLDLGCGSGYIGLSIKQKTNADVTLSDIDPEAILQSQINATLNKLKVQIIQSDLFTNIDDKFDVIICNPPYIPQNTNLAPSVLNYEPHHALFGGKDGNDFYRKILKKVHHYLKKDGILVLEISPDNSKFLRQKGFRIFLDINNKKRIAVKQY